MNGAVFPQNFLAADKKSWTFFAGILRIFNRPLLVKVYLHCGRRLKQIRCIFDASQLLNKTIFGSEY